MLKRPGLRFSLSAAGPAGHMSSPRTIAAVVLSSAVVGCAVFVLSRGVSPTPADVGFTTLVQTAPCPTNAPVVIPASPAVAAGPTVAPPPPVASTQPNDHLSVCTSLWEKKVAQFVELRAKRRQRAQHRLDGGAPPNYMVVAFDPYGTHLHGCVGIISWHSVVRCAGTVRVSVFVSVAVRLSRRV
jgi:hypothetical protein